MRKGAAYLALAMAITPLADGLSKDLAAGHTAFSVAFMRYFAAGVLAVAVSGISGRKIELPHTHIPAQLLRTALMAAAMTLMIAALAMVPLALAVGGFLIAPMVAVVVATIFLGETMTTERILGAGISFIGAILISKPQGTFEAGSLLALAGGCVMGLYLALSRSGVPKGDAFPVLAVQSLLGSMMILPLAIYFGIAWPNGTDLFEIVALGAVSAFCHYLVISAYHRADAGVLAPFFYCNIIFSIPLGFLWFGEVPSAMALAGMAAIALGGILALQGRAKLRLRRLASRIG